METIKLTVAEQVESVASELLKEYFRKKIEKQSELPSVFCILFGVFSLV
jgi:hypothetical protein